MCIDNDMIPHLRSRADNAARGDIRACADTGIVGQNHGRMHKSRRAPSGNLRSVNQFLPRIIVPHGNGKSDILPGKLLRSLLDGSVHKISTEALSTLFRRVVGVTEYLPRPGRAVAVSCHVHRLGDPPKLRS